MLGTNIGEALKKECCSTIAQGGAVSNAGAIWPVNVGRILKAPLLNYGFSGSCLMQLPVAEQLGAATFNGGRQCENAPLLLLYIRESCPMFIYI